MNQKEHEKAENTDIDKALASAGETPPVNKDDTGDLSTEGPLSEKDEVKKAEARTQKAMSKGPGN